MKNILCKLGFHKRHKYGYMKVTRQHKNGKKFHRNYIFCERCGKHIATFKKVKTGGMNNG